MKHRYIIVIALILLTICQQNQVSAQILNFKDNKEYTDSIRKEFDKSPYFSLYKDNYFTVGTAIGQKPTATNSDVKFQISMALRLTKTVLPWHTYLFLFYSQKTFWNVFEESLPMRDMNFNPGIGWTKPFFNKDRYIGKLSLIIEHESNGRDGDESRSWNRVSFAGSVNIDENLIIHGKYWIPIIDGMNNKDILKYSGIYQTGLIVMSPNKKFNWGLTLVRRSGWKPRFNTIIDFSWNFHHDSNVWFFAQYYNGYGEGLLDYNQHHSRLRVGIVFKPRLFSEF
jgi:phospholipase A1